MTHHLWRSVALVAALVAMLAVNALANSLPLNGLTTGEISDRFDVRFVPAGYVFAIWGLIYLALITWTANLLRPSVGARPWADRSGGLFGASCLVNGAWLVAWHYERFVVSMALMALLLGLLIGLYLTLDVGRAGRRGARRWLIEAPISLYLGWITVATAANATSTLEHLGWGGWGLADDTWAVVLLAVSTSLAAAFAIARRDVVYTAVIAWATAGIAVAQADYRVVAISAWVACGASVVLALVAARPSR